MRWKSRFLWKGYGLLAVAQVGVVAVGLAALVRWGWSGAALAAVLVISLLLLNAGLALVVRRFRAQKNRRAA